MNIYAEYFSENGINYRKTTIIQIGDSWEIIGSAILKNPGSAIPLDDEIEKDTLDQISGICPNSKPHYWKKFKADPTMRCLEKIFDGSYINSSKEISGIILLFNLHYIREADINKARNLFDKSSSTHTFPDMEEVKNLIKDKPVFIGWFDEHEKLKNENVKLFAADIFCHLTSDENSYLEKEFSQNQFYHPLYVGRLYNNKNFKNWPIYSTLQKFQQQFL